MYIDVFDVNAYILLAESFGINTIISVKILKVDMDTMQVFLSLLGRKIIRTAGRTLWIIKSLAHLWPADVKPTVAPPVSELQRQTPILNILFGTKVCITIKYPLRGYF